MRDYLTSLHVATDSEELFVLVLRGVDDAIQKVNILYSPLPSSLSIFFVIDKPSFMELFMVPF